MLVSSVLRVRRLARRVLGSTRPEGPAGDTPAAEQADTPAGVPNVQAPPAHFHEGYVEEISTRHVHGVARDLLCPGARVECEVFLADTGEVIGQGRADQFKHGLYAADIGDGSNGFWIGFDRQVSEPERRNVRVRVRGDAHDLFVPPVHSTAFEPILHVAMDIVDNCNLRCPFCLYDYRDTRTTHFMDRDTLQAALRFLPFTRDGEFWFSCLHEPALHPDLLAYVDGVPAELRGKLFFTSNIAKRMPQDYFDWLVANGMHHVNISIESRTPAIYEKMRKGARFAIFQENWDRLMASVERTANPTRIRYIAMAYKSNLRELPGLARYLLEERHASQVEIRYTYDVASIPPGFREEEFLEPQDWAWLAAQLSGFSAQQVVLLAPPASEPPAAEAEPGGTEEQVGKAGPVQTLPGRYMFRLSWDGTLDVVGLGRESHHDCAVEHVITRTNVRDIDDPSAFLERLVKGEAMEVCPA